MSQYEKSKHTNKGESRAHALAHKYDSKKTATVVNHLHFERNNGFESTKHKDKRGE